MKSFVLERSASMKCVPDYRYILKQINFRKKLRIWTVILHACAQFAYSNLKILSTYLWCVCGGGGYALNESNRVLTHAIRESGVLSPLGLSFAESAVNSQWVQDQFLPVQACLVPLVPNTSPCSISSHCWQRPSGPPSTSPSCLEVYTWELCF